jgi:hypothetical protein
MYKAGRLLRRLLMVALVVAVASPAGGAIAQPTRRLTPTAKTHVRQQLAGTPAAAPAGPYQIMGAGDISADPDASNVDDLRTSELMV